MIQTLRDQLNELENVNRPGETFSKGHKATALPPLITTCSSASRDLLNMSTEDECAEMTNTNHSPQYSEDLPPLPCLSSVEDEPSTFFEHNLLAQSPHLDIASVLQDSKSPEADECCDLGRMMKPINQIIDSVENLVGDPQSVQTTSVEPSPNASGKRTPEVCKCDQLLNSRRQWVLPLRRHADSLLQRYFSRHNIAFPILHEPTFRRQYAQIWDSAPTTASSNSPICSGLCKQLSQGQLLLPTTYAVFATASLFETMDLEQNVMRANSFFRFAQDVDIFEVMENEVEIELVQLLLLMGRYLQSTERFAKCKNISGLAIRTAQSLGLHYDVDEAQKRGLLPRPVTQLQREMRARVWYGCVLLER